MTAYVWFFDQADVDARREVGFVWKPDSVEAYPGLHVESGEYQVLDPERRIVKTWGYEGSMSPGKNESVISIDFRSSPGPITKVTLREEGQVLSDMDLRNQARAKWATALAELEPLLKTE